MEEDYTFERQKKRGLIPNRKEYIYGERAIEAEKFIIDLLKDLDLKRNPFGINLVNEDLLIGIEVLKIASEGTEKWKDKTTFPYKGLNIPVEYMRYYRINPKKFFFLMLNHDESSLAIAQGKDILKHALRFEPFADHKNDRYVPRTFYNLDKRKVLFADTKTDVNLIIDFIKQKGEIK